MVPLLIIRSIPYIIALLLTTLEIPSRLIAYRHRHLVDRKELHFATRWNKVAELIGYPFVILFYALSQIGDLFHAEAGVTVAAWAMVAGVVYAALVLMAFWLFGGTDLHKEESLPSLRLFRWTIEFDGLVRATKAVGVLFPCVLDLWLTSRQFVTAAKVIAPNH